MTALGTLSHLPIETQRDALASATRSLLPRPPAGAQDQQLDTSLELQQNLIDEIRKQLKLRPDDNSPSAQAKLLRFISETLSSLILGNTNIAEIKARLGQRGDLAPKDYTIEYPKDFQNFQRAFAIRPNHVADTLRNPSHVQHLTPPKDFPVRDFQNISLYSSMHLTQKGEAFTLLVQTIRVGDVQQVYSVWRVYHSDVEMPEEYSPLGMFRAIVTKYGEDLSVRNKSIGRFLLYDVLPDVTADQMDNTKAASDETGLTTHQLIAFSNEKTGTSYVVIGYAINVMAYCADLRRHGVDVHPELVTFGAFGKHEVRLVKRKVAS